MRDQHGRYTTSKALADNGPEWASGCDKCKCGVAASADLTGAVPLYLERLVQASDGHLTFCTCQAGVAYREALVKRYRIVQSQDKETARILTTKNPGSDAPLTPENTLRIDGLLDVARAAIYAALAKNRPTVHA